MKSTVPPRTPAGIFYEKERVLGRAVPPTTLAGTSCNKRRLVKSTVPTNPLAGNNIEKKRLISSNILEMRKIWEGNNIFENRKSESGASTSPKCDEPIEREKRP